MEPRKDLIEENIKYIEKKLDKIVKNKNEVIEHIVIVQEIMPKIKEYFSHTNNFKKQEKVIDFVYQNCPNAKNSILNSKELKSVYRRNGILNKNEFTTLDLILKCLLSGLIVCSLNFFNIVNATFFLFLFIAAALEIFCTNLFSKINLYRIK